MANFNFNKIILGGRMVADPELKTTQSGIPFCGFSIAVSRKKSRSDEERKTDFFECKSWNKQAETIAKYFRKGSCICISGSMTQEKWTDKNGQNRISYVVLVDEVTFVDGLRDDAGTPADGAKSDASSGAGKANYSPYAAPSSASTAESQTADTYDPIDLPF